MFKENQPLAVSSLHPDFVLVKDKSAIIINIATTFENDPKGFDEIHSLKTKKYQAIAQSLKRYVIGRGCWGYDRGRHG